MPTKVIKVIREEKTGSKDRIDLLYDDESHEFILRFYQWGMMRDCIVLEGLEFISMLKAGVAHYNGLNEDDFRPVTDTLQ